MIIFLNDDHAYLSWVRSHRDGFVLEGRRQGRGGRLIHRSTCAAVRSGKRRRWTTGQQFKACSLSLTELVDWARETYGGELACCAGCQPTCEPVEGIVTDKIHEARLTPLASNILNYALETAIVHLNQGSAPYRVTIRDVAHCLHKTPAQLTGAIQRLLAQDLLEVAPLPRRDGRLVELAEIWPTMAALRTLDGYADWDKTDLEKEIQRLRGETKMAQAEQRCPAACG